MPDRTALERATWALDNAKANLAAAQKQGAPGVPMWAGHGEFIMRLRAEVERLEVEQVLAARRHTERRAVVA
jgi:hypothetical protein